MSEPFDELLAVETRRGEAIAEWQRRHRSRVWSEATWTCPLCQRILQALQESDLMYVVTQHQIDHGSDWLDYWETPSLRSGAMSPKPHSSDEEHAMPRIVTIIDDDANRAQTFRPCRENRHDDCVGSHRLADAIVVTVQQVCACLCHWPSADTAAPPTGAMSGSPD